MVWDTWNTSACSETQANKLLNSGKQSQSSGGRKTDMALDQEANVSPPWWHTCK